MVDDSKNEQQFSEDEKLVVEWEVVMEEFGDDKDFIEDEWVVVMVEVGEVDNSDDV